ncbi:hypothetical protein [Tissierella sp. Yu-01]|uniref:hypothetical protein n=1 Tax=Tissierella sp. Yu-01 TaxID=3035694 RepID=UPI00240D5C8E|nr:hypothetical protein [Tissierella sp. Yu-01]WFA07714.1 hypothetical protein P3962_08210 [Tissierella sp. Yu-01]
MELKKYERGDIIFLYILDCGNYKNHIKTHWVKFVPDFFLPRFKPSVLEEIIRDGDTVGKVVGINIKEFDYSNDNECQLFIDGIKKLKGPDDTNIYIEDSRKYPIEFLKKINELTELKFSSGYNIRILNLPILLRQVYKSLGREINCTDTLIISDERKIVLDIIKVLTEEINFFTVYGIEPTLKDEFYEEVLESTGISIFQPKKIDKVIKNYGTVINFSNKIDVDNFDFRNQSVIIDFSVEKPLKSMQKKKKNILYIQDIILESNLTSKWVSEYVNPELFVSINGIETTFSQIYTNNNFYFIDDYVRGFIKKKGII